MAGAARETRDTNCFPLPASSLFCFTRVLCAILLESRSVLLARFCYAVCGQSSGRRRALDTNCSGPRLLSSRCNSCSRRKDCLYQCAHTQFASRRSAELDAARTSSTPHSIARTASTASRKRTPAWSPNLL